MRDKSVDSVKTFNGEQVRDCPICMEEFTKGELIQPFGVWVLMNFIHHASILGYLEEKQLVQFVVKICLSNTACTSRGT